MKPEHETKKERFERVASARTEKIIAMMRLLGNCSNRSTYEYTQEHVEEMFDAIQETLDTARRRFVTTASGAPRFAFSGTRPNVAVSVNGSAFDRTADMDVDCAELHEPPPDVGFEMVSDMCCSQADPCDNEDDADDKE